MQVAFPDEIVNITKKVLDAGFKIYLVGGALRDKLLGKETKDWDFATNARPEEIQKLFSESFYDNKFGTVGIPTKEHRIVEVTTFRSEKGYSDKRRPDEVTWGRTIEEDLQRRDFTINAIAIPIPHPTSSFQKREELATVSSPLERGRSKEGDLIDPFGGQSDIKAKLIRAVGNPDQRFQEDALRLLRAVRFAAQLSFQIEGETLNAMQANAPLIQNISGERIRDELCKILASDFPYDGFMLLKSTGILSEILPELEQCFGVSQIGPNRHHIYDVGTHCMLSLKETPSKDPLVRFAALVHDIGKPTVLGKDDRGNPTFYNHEVVGANIAKDIANRLHFSKVQREKLCALVRWHQFSVDDMQTDSAIRRFIRNVGVENIQDMIDVRIGDRLGSGIPKHREEGWRLKKFRERIEKELNPPFAITDLKVNGNDIMQELNIKPGPKVGQILQKLFEEVDEDLSKNNREYLLERIRKIQKNSE